MTGRLRYFLNFHTDMCVVRVLHIFHLRLILERIVETFETLLAMIELWVHRVCSQISNCLPITSLLFATVLYIDTHDRCRHYVFIDNRASDWAIITIIQLLFIWVEWFLRGTHNYSIWQLNWFQSFLWLAYKNNDIVGLIFIATLGRAWLARIPFSCLIFHFFVCWTNCLLLLICASIFVYAHLRLMSNIVSRVVYICPTQRC